MKLLMFTGGLSLATACSVGTDNVDDGQIWGHFSATSGDGETVDASASLFFGAPLSFTWVTLEDDDVLTVSEGGAPLEMERRSFLGITSYEAGFDAAVPDTEYTFDLYIAEEDADYRATASLPSPFAFTGPASGASFSRSSDAIEITWSEGSSDAMSAHVDVSCGEHVQVFDFPAESDSGSLTIPAGAIETVDEDGEAVDGTCPATLALWRSRAGEVPSELLYASATAAQVRSISLVLEP